jgi:hypothetical protein
MLDWLFGHYLNEIEIQTEIERLTETDPIISQLFRATKIKPQVRECPEGIRSCYRIKEKEIWVSPSGYDSKSLREALLHEYIHADDHIVQEIDLSSAKELAISEIHAMKECECVDSPGSSVSIRG